MSAVDNLISRWRADADVLRRHGADALAKATEMHVAELALAMEADADALLSQEQAARESGYSSRHLRGLEADGALVNRGRKGSPLYRRGDLPKKPGSTTTTIDAERRAAAVLDKLRN